MVTADGRKICGRMKWKVENAEEVQRTQTGLTVQGKYFGKEGSSDKQRIGLQNTGQENN